MTVKGVMGAAFTGAVVSGAVLSGALAWIGPVQAATKGSGAKRPANLTILVTNDDGVTAPGIDAAVQALRTLPGTTVTVVAPATNQSGSGGKTTKGTLVATKATTASGYPAEAVAGYPADTVIWAVKDHHLRPDLVVSGINFGENVGPLATISGTVGAARKAVSFGIPAIAVSQGVDNGLSPDFSEGAAPLLQWVRNHRAALLARRGRPSASLNVPTCATGVVNGPVKAPLASSITGVNLGAVNCASPITSFKNDVDAFVNGYAVLSPLYP